MKRVCALFVLLVFLFTLIPHVYAEEAKSKEEGKPQKRISRRKKLPDITYKPINLGIPGNRTGGGSRSKGGELPTVIAVVPEHIAGTLDPQPHLVWFLSKPTDHSVEIVINDRELIDPIFRKTIDCSKEHGLMIFKLNENNVRFETGKEYDWSVAVVPDMENRSRDITATGVLKCLRPGHEMLKKISSADPYETPSIYAGEGLWYDGLTQLNHLIEKTPNDKELKEYRINFIKQVGIFEEKEFKKLNISEIDGVKIK